MKILIVEDEHRIATSIKKGLEQERFSVDIAYTGTDGYDFASAESYDVIMLDVLLPGIDGLTLCRKLRDNNIHTPILMLTAKGQTQDKITGLDSGADDYLTKPFSFEELLARIRALARRPQQTMATVLSVGDLTVDITSFDVKRAGKSITLSSKEFMLLVYLMKNANKIMTKDQIISHVWDYDADILPNTIEVYMRNLRNKIDKPFANKKPLLQTARGFGYKIEG